MSGEVSVPSDDDGLSAEVLQRTSPDEGRTDGPSGSGASTLSRSEVAQNPSVHNGRRNRWNAMTIIGSLVVAVLVVCDAAILIRGLGSRWRDAAKVASVQHLQEQPPPGRQSILLLLTLPDLKPAPPDAAKTRGWGNKITVMFESGSHARDPWEVADNMLRWGHLDRNNYTHLSNGCRLYSGQMTVAQRLFMCELPDRVLSVECDGSGDSIFPSCTVRENVDDEFEATYHFGADHSADIIQIDDQVRALYRHLKPRLFRR